MTQENREAQDAVHAKTEAARAERMTYGQIKQRPAAVTREAWNESFLGDSSKTQPG